MAPTGRNRFAFDAELLLRTEDAAAITATGNSDLFDLTESTAEWNLGDIGSKQEFVIVVHVTAADVSGDGTYSVAVNIADDAGSTVGTGSSLSVTEAGTYYLPVIKENVVAVGGSQVGVTATLGGTTPSFDYFAYVSPFYGTGH